MSKKCRVLCYRNFCESREMYKDLVAEQMIRSTGRSDSWHGSQDSLLLLPYSLS